jgi:hypothetical protein
MLANEPIQLANDITRMANDTAAMENERDLATGDYLSQLNSPIE